MSATATHPATDSAATSGRRLAGLAEGRSTIPAVLAQSANVMPPTQSELPNEAATSSPTASVEAADGARASRSMRRSAATAAVAAAT